MKTQKLTRGNESVEHIVLKGEVLRLLHHWGYGTVLGEHLNCDLVAIHPGSAAVLGVEIERFDRNVHNNAPRNFAQGCKDVLIVCPDLKTLGAIARKLSSTLPSDKLARTALATISALRLTRPYQFPNQTTSKLTTEKSL